MSDGGGETCSIKKVISNEGSREYGQESQVNSGQDRVQNKNLNVNEGYNYTGPYSTNVLKKMYQFLLLLKSFFGGLFLCTVENHN